ncbi:MAG: ShlB/FhaC/HecB family hemolysin secretion/activation protein [Desulfobacterales bacterium]|nr:ShlB/FhaC/HecB family hemolysin secretion/activation protein [Desulfobacterales bacterium]
MPVYAQAPPHGQDQPSIDNAEVAEPADIDAKGDPEEGADGVYEEEMGILITDIVFSGNKVISTQALREITAPYRGQAMTLQEMGELTDLITMTYQEKGYILARAYLPEQEIAKGVLEVSIAEGNVGKIIVVGQKHFSPGVIKKYFSDQEKLGVIREDLLEKGILFSNEVPQVKTDLVLKEGEKTGDVDVVINAKEVSSVTFGIDASLDYNNYGSERVGADRYGVTLDMVDHRLGTKFRFKGVTGDYYDRSRLISMQLTAPVFDFGSEITGSYFNGTTFLKNEVQQATVRYVIPTDSVVENVGIQYRQPIIKKRNMSLDVIAGYQKKSFKLFYDNDAVQSNRIDDREILFGRLSFENLDRYLGRNFANFEYHRGELESEYLRSGGGKDDLHTRSDADSQFWKIFAQAGRIQKIYGPTNLMVRGSAQYTEDRLVQTEQTAIGGYWTVRGHPVSSVLGDSGYTVTTEVISAPPYLSDKVIFGQRIGQLVQIMGFFDHGGVYNNDWETQTSETYAEYLSGAGVGFRLYYKDLFTFKYSLAFPIDEPGNDNNHVHYFEGTYKFF